MKLFDSEVTECTGIGPGYFRISFTVPWETAPQSGQFVNISCGKPSFLRRPFSIAAYEGSQASVIFRQVGKGTAALSSFRAGDSLSVLGPLGKGFPELPPDTDIIYVGGGCGLPPLLFDASQRGDSCRRTALAGFRNASDAVLKSEFEQTGTEYITVTEDGSAGKKGLVTDILKKNLDSANGKSIIFASGPMLMLKCVSELLEKYGAEGYLSLERYMGCGFGVCNGCVHPVRNRNGEAEYRKVCVDGPVFRASDVLWDRK